MVGALLVVESEAILRTKGKLAGGFGLSIHVLAESREREETSSVRAAVRGGSDMTRRGCERGRAAVGAANVVVDDIIYTKGGSRYVR